MYYTDTAGDSVVSRFFVSPADPDVADPTETVILTLDQPFSNHNGGTVAFGGDGFLYFSPGDGVRDEIWAFGLRNPYRFRFDRHVADLWIADMGQDALEEIDFEPRNDPGGRNWGWDVMQGDECNVNDPARNRESSGCGGAAALIIVPLTLAARRRLR